MNCPLCNEPMLVLELDEVEIDHCLTCQGVWLDAGELELLLGSAEEKSAVLNSFPAVRSASEKKHRCPICRKTMDKVTYTGNNQTILIDQCRRDHGIWFDKGELYQVIAHRAGESGNNRVVSLLAEMFGKHG